MKCIASCTLTLFYQKILLKYDPSVYRKVKYFLKAKLCNYIKTDSNSSGPFANLCCCQSCDTDNNSDLNSASDNSDSNSDSNQVLTSSLRVNTAVNIAIINSKKRSIDSDGRNGDAGDTTRLKQAIDHTTSQCPSRTQRCPPCTSDYTPIPTAGVLDTSYYTIAVGAPGLRSHSRPGCSSSIGGHYTNTGNVTGHEHHLERPDNNNGTLNSSAVEGLEPCRGGAGGLPCCSLMLGNKKKSLITKAWRRRIKQPQTPSKTSSQCSPSLQQTSAVASAMQLPSTKPIDRFAQHHLSQLSQNHCTNVSTEITGNDSTLKSAVEHVLNQLKVEQLKDLNHSLETVSAGGPCVLVPKEELCVGENSRVSPVHLSLAVWRWSDLRSDALLRPIPPCTRDNFLCCINPYHSAVYQEPTG